MIGLRLALLLAALVLLQAGFLPGLGLSHRPDLLRLYATLAGFFFGTRAGLLAGAAAGAIADLLSGRLLGLHALLGLLAGAAGGWAGRQVVRDQAVLAVAFAVAVLALEDAATFVALRLLEVRVPLARALGGVLVPGLLADAVAAVPLYALLRRLYLRSLPLTGRIEAFPPRPARGRPAVRGARAGARTGL